MSFDDYVSYKPPLSAEERRATKALLDDLCNQSADWPQASELARYLRDLCERELPPTNCLIVWVDEINRETDLWSVMLDRSEMEALAAAHGDCLEEDDENILTLLDALAKRGRKVHKRTEGMWHVAKVTVI